MNGKRVRVGLAVVLLLSLGLAPTGIPATGAANLWNWTGRTSGTTQDLMAVVCCSSQGSDGWAVGAQGAIVHTQDLGANWAPQNSGTGVTLRDVVAECCERRGAYAVGDGGTILKTIDGGATWVARNPGVSANLTAAAGGRNLLVVGTGGTIVRTDDDGVTWKLKSTGPQDLFDVAWGVRGVAWAVGAGGVILRSGNSGDTWFAQNSHTTATLRALAMQNPSTAYVVGDGGVILKTTDDGVTWAAQNSGTTNALYGLRVSSVGETVVAVGDGGTVLTSGDGGATWVPQPSGTSQGLRAVNCCYWAVGVGGVLLNARDLTSRIIATVRLGTAISVGIDNRSVDYGAIGLNQSAVSAMITASNNGEAAETFLIQGSNAIAQSTGDNDWALGSAPGVNIYRHGFGDSNAGPFADLTTTAKTLAAGVPQNGTKSFYLELKTPTSTGGLGTRRADVAVIAVAP